MLYADQTFAGDLIDPNTGVRLVVRIPSWFGAAALASATEPIAVPLDVLPPPAPVKRGIWTPNGYLAPDSY